MTRPTRQADPSAEYWKPIWRNAVPNFHTALATTLALGIAAAAHIALADASPQHTARDSHTLIATRTPIGQIPTRNPDGSVNALIEIPAGTNAKWEVRKQDGALAWEFENGRPRVVDYLAYPANYGMIPRTLLARKDGGDGDPLDVIVLGPALERGSIARVHVIGALRLTDTGERDDKLIAAAMGSPFESVRDIADLESDFPGVTEIVEIWFSNYKGRDVLQASGFGDAKSANAILERAEQSHAEQ
jgi:inorganic pyrophosphatase